MTYGVVVEAAQPLEVYRAVHAELMRETAGRVEGLLVHVAHQTPEGFSVLEVWESREHADRCNREVVWPIAARLAGDRPLPETRTQEFEVAGLVVPAAALAW